jgi:hypothetical protein
MTEQDEKKATSKIWLFTQTKDGHLVPIAPEVVEEIAEEIAEIVPEKADRLSPWWKNTKEYLAFALWQEWFARGASPGIKGSCLFCAEPTTADAAAGHAPDCIYIRAKALVEQPSESCSSPA